MNRKGNLLCIVSLFLVLLTSCSEYQNALKDDADTKVKYDLAEKLYNEGDHKRAVRLFEQIVPKYVGKPQGERVIYFYADSYYQLKDYYLAAYQFERFSKSYPKSNKAEEAAFNVAKSYYYLSPKYSIDQTETYTAMEKLQLYINAYPNSERVPEANEMVRELTTKLEKKAFEIGKQFNKISDYYAAIKSLELFVSENPGTPFKEDALFYKFDSNYQIAINSIPAKKQERLNNSKEAYDELIKSFPETKYAKVTRNMVKVIETQLKQFSK